MTLFRWIISYKIAQLRRIAIKNLIYTQTFSFSPQSQTEGWSSLQRRTSCIVTTTNSSYDWCPTVAFD